MRISRNLAALACIVSALLTCGCSWQALQGISPLGPFDNFRTLRAGVAYRSAQLDGADLAHVFQEYDIQTVINLRGANPGEDWYEQEQAACASAGVQLIDIPMSASELPTRAALLSLYDSLLAAEYPLLMHCKRGADRTGAAAAIWRMIVAGESKDVAEHELSPAYGHFSLFYPAMDQLIEMFEPTRAWIEHEYDPG